MKAFKTYAQQVDILLSRGLVDDSGGKELETRLQSVGYYRLSGYLYPFRITDNTSNGNKKSEQFRPGTTLSRVWEYYLFDRRLRLLILDAIERIEITLRVQIAYEWARAYHVPNPQGFPGSFSAKYRKKEREIRLKAFQDYYERSSEDFACHYKEHYHITSVEDLPVWVFIQFSTFGSLQKLFAEGLPLPVRQDIARYFGFSDVNYFTKILALLLQARNACAHHSRIWNKLWKYDATSILHPHSTRLKPIVGMTTDARWSSYMHVFNREKTAFLLTVLLYLLRKSATTSRWETRLKALLTQDAPVRSIVQEMGFPANWQTHELWKL